MFIEQNNKKFLQKDFNIDLQMIFHHYDHYSNKIEFDLLNNDDAALDLADRNGTTLVLAMRGWQYGLFKPFIKSNSDKPKP